MSGGIGAVAREGFMLLVSTGGPLIGALLVAGLLVGVFQATTQINDPAVGFMPRMAVALGSGWLLGSWVLERFARYFASAMHRMSDLM